MTIDDYEIIQTNYPHPSITTGQQTNGPATVWVRQVGDDWINTGARSAHKVRRELAKNGLSRIASGAWSEYDRTEW